MTPYDAPMSGSAAAAAERYLRTFDRMAVDDGALDELMALFSDDATVQFSEEREPLEGRATLREVYGGFGAQLADSRHFWTLEAAGDRAVLVRWLQGSRWTDGRLVARSGEEVVTVDDGGLITSLRNRRTTPDQGR